MKRDAVDAAFKLTLPIFAAYWLIGLGYGLFAMKLGLGRWFPIVTAACVYSGSVEFILASMVAGSFRPAAVFVMAVLVGSRHLFYGIAMLDKYKGAGWRKFFTIFMLSDETFALTCDAEPPPGVGIHDYRLAAGVLDWVYWLSGVTVGTFAADWLARFRTDGVEFIMTAMFVAIFAENWSREKRHAGSLIGAGVSVLAVILFGPENFMIPAMAGILGALTLFKRKLQ